MLSSVSGTQDLRFLGGPSRNSVKVLWCGNSLIIARLPSLGVWYSKHAILGAQSY